MVEDIVQVLTPPQSESSSRKKSSAASARFFEIASLRTVLNPAYSASVRTPSLIWIALPGHVHPLAPGISGWECHHW